MGTEVVASFDEAAVRFFRDGYCVLPYRGFQDSISRLSESWLSFAQKGGREHDRWRIDANKDPDDGLVLRKGERSPEGWRYDKKLWFHYRPRIPDLYERLNGKWPQDIFVKEAASIFDGAMAIFRLFVGALDFHCPGAWDLLPSRYLSDLHALRLLYYGGTGPVSATSHVDRSFVTLHLADSCPGLVLRTKKGPVPYEALPGQVLLFAGHKLELWSNKKIRAVPHWVEGRSGSGERWSVVFFGHVKGYDGTPLHNRRSRAR